MMSSRYRFPSDTNRSLFEEALMKRGVVFASLAFDVRVDEYVDEIDELVREFSGYVIEEDTDYAATGGGVDAGFQDTAAASVRSNPPDESRGALYPDHSQQIVSQGGSPPRSYWGQPEPVPVAGINKGDEGDVGNRSGKRSVARHGCGGVGFASLHDGLHGRGNAEKGVHSTRGRDRPSRPSRGSALDAHR
jgi:hypothetical protein